MKKYSFRRFRTAPALVWMLCVSVSLPLTQVQSQILSPELAPYADDVDVALERGFAYLAGAQLEDGSFSGEYGASAGVVALAGMSFLAAGHTPGNTGYGITINRCIDYVMKQQNTAGYIYTVGRKDKGMYSHNISTLFLAEVSGMLDPERDPIVRESLSRAVQVILKAQGVEKKQSEMKGGWRYSPGDKESDLSVSGWALMALKAARLNGIPVPDENIRMAVEYVLDKQSDQGSFGYMRSKDNHDGRVTLNGLATLCLTLTGYHDSPEVMKARSFLENNYQKLPRESNRLYGLYYSTQAAFQLGGSTWQQIAPWMYKTYLPGQLPDGSWGEKSAGDGVEKSTPVYRTSLVLLSLAVPYRQLPIYQRDETIDED